MFFAPLVAVALGKLLCETIMSPNKFPSIPKVPPKTHFPSDFPIYTKHRRK